MLQGQKLLPDPSDLRHRSHHVDIFFRADFVVYDTFWQRLGAISMSQNVVL